MCLQYVGVVVFHALFAMDCHGIWIVVCGGFSHLCGMIGCNLEMIFGRWRLYVFCVFGDEP